MSLLKKISPIAKGFAGKKSASNFINYLKRIFDEETTEQVLEAFDKIKLPAPSKGNQYLKSNEGALVLLNKYAVVVRVEPKESADNFYVRVDDSGCILQPLGSLDAGKAVVEICPGCDIERDEASIEFMKEQLKDEGLAFVDDKLENQGRLHTDDKRYPEGLPVIFDRLAVSRIKKNVKLVKNPISEEAKKEQERFIAPFRKAFKQGLADGSKMSKFWVLVKSYADEGKFIRGWNDNSDFFDKIDYLSKTSMAEDVARHYSRKLEKFEKA